MGTFNLTVKDKASAEVLVSAQCTYQVGTNSLQTLYTNSSGQISFGFTDALDISIVCKKDGYYDQEWNEAAVSGTRNELVEMLPIPAGNARDVTFVVMGGGQQVAGSISYSVSGGIARIRDFGPTGFTIRVNQGDSIDYTITVPGYANNTSSIADVQLDQTVTVTMVAQGVSFTVTKTTDDPAMNSKVEINGKVVGFTDYLGQFSLSNCIPFSGMQDIKITGDHKPIEIHEASPSSGTFTKTLTATALVGSPLTIPFKIKLVDAISHLPVVGVQVMIRDNAAENTVVFASDSDGLLIVDLLSVNGGYNVSVKPHVTTRNPAHPGIVYTPRTSAQEYGWVTQGDATPWRLPRSMIIEMMPLTQRFTLNFINPSGTPVSVPWADCALHSRDPENDMPNDRHIIADHFVTEYSPPSRSTINISFRIANRGGLANINRDLVVGVAGYRTFILPTLNHVKSQELNIVLRPIS